MTRNLIALALDIATGKGEKAAEALAPQYEQARPRSLQDDIERQEAEAEENGYTLDQPCANQECDGIATDEGSKADAGYCYICRKVRTILRARRQERHRLVTRQETGDSRPEFPDRKDVDNGILHTAELNYGSTWDDGQSEWELEERLATQEELASLKASFDRRSLTRGGE